MALGASSCEVTTQDRTTEAGAQPDRVADTSDVTVWRNIDNAPTVVTFCADGLRFAATLSADGTRAPQLVWIPEHDRRCQS